MMNEPSSSLRDRVERLASRFGPLGLWYPTETAVKCVVTLAFLDKGHPSGFMDAALQASRSFKAAVKMRRVAHKGPRANLPNFQQSIREFEANHPAWFRAGYSEAGPLAPVPVPTMMLRNLEAQLGCRNTKRGVKWMQAEKDTKALACPDASTSAPLTLHVFFCGFHDEAADGCSGLPSKHWSGWPSKTWSGWPSRVANFQTWVTDNAASAILSLAIWVIDNIALTSTCAGIT